MKEVKYNFNILKDNINLKITNSRIDFDALINIIPGYGDVDLYRREIVSTYFVAENKEEYEMIVKNR